MEFESLFAENEVDDVEVLPEEHNDRGLWFGQSDIDFQIPVPEPIIPQEGDFDPLYIYPQGDSFAGLYLH